MLTHIDLDNFLNGRSSGVQNGNDVLAALLSFLGDTTFNEVSIVIGWDLARNIDLAVGFDSLGL